MTGPQDRQSATFQFGRDLRLLRPSQFRQVFNRATRYSHRNLTILTRPNDCGLPRLGLAIAKKHAKLAVERSRIKRQIRESFRLHQRVIGGMDIVVLSRPGVTKADVRELRAFIDSAWEKIAQRCDAS